ncbi:MAG: hypothetical protein Q9162_003544 [Coniocarpon cinnabarinum]
MASSSANQSNNQTAFGGRGPELMGVSWSLMGLTTVLLCLRVMTKLTIVKRSGWQPLLWGWGGWLIGALAVAFLTVAVHHGLGNHLEDVKAAGTITPAIKYQWIADALISLAIGVGKFAVVTFYAEIQGPTHKWRLRALLLLATTNLANNIILVFLIFFQCSPPQALWDKSIQGTCSLSDVNLYYGIAGGAWNAATDLVLAVYPISIIYRLQMRLRLKLGLCILMGIGLFTAICSIVKTCQFKRVEATQDPTWAITPLILWGISEMWVILITASVAPLWPLIRQVAERIDTFSSHYNFSSIFNLSSLKRSRPSHQSSSTHLTYDADPNGARPYEPRLPSTEGSEDVVLQSRPAVGVRKDIVVERERGENGRRNAETITTVGGNWQETLRAVLMQLGLIREFFLSVCQVYYSGRNSIGVVTWTGDGMETGNKTVNYNGKLHDFTLSTLVDLHMASYVMSSIMSGGMTPSFVVVICHGSYHTPGIYQPLIKALQAEGVSAHCPQLATSDLRLMNIGDIHNPDYDRAIPENGYPAPADDVAIVAALLSSLILENHAHVLLVGHSSGALVATQATTPALQSQNLRKSGAQGGLIGLFYVSGGVGSRRRVITQLHEAARRQ